MDERSLKQINLDSLRRKRFHPSPDAWEDQVLYFMMLDRFSDGNENGYLDNKGNQVTSGTTPFFRPANVDNAIQTPEEAGNWREAGIDWQGGTLKGLTSKIGYLQRMGISAIWVSPVFKQTAYDPHTYHGYGIQNYLTVDPHFGTPDDLKEMVKTAHKHGIYVILDIILNHSGDVFEYDADRYPMVDPQTGTSYMDPRWDGAPYKVAGFNDKTGEPTLPFAPINLKKNPDAWPDGAVWPVEFQNPGVYTAKGRIINWDNWPEYLDGDFSSLKDVHLGTGDTDDYVPSPALMALCNVYKYWMAFADIDGYRIDTVKHMDPGAVRFFASVMHEFAQTLGKDDFYLIGEITGGRDLAFQLLETTGLNAALGIDDIPDKLEYMVKGYRNPEDYFNLFRNSILIQKESHIWFRDKVVTFFDDHDQVRKGSSKARFCANEPRWEKQLFNVMAVNVTTLGIPCIYYGTEQAFDGSGDSDRYLREAMFGGTFGAFRSKGVHFFDELNPVYKEFARLLTLRKKKLALRRGRQYLRMISGNGIDFGYPRMLGGEIRSVVPWIRLFDDQELLCAFNTDSNQPRTAWVDLPDQIDDPNVLGATLKCIFSNQPNQEGKEIKVQQTNGHLAVQLEVPAAGFVIYEKL